MSSTLNIGATLGIVGGGQLGRMLCVAASRLGFRTVVLDPGHDAPAFQVADTHHIAQFDDIEALVAFAASCDAVTFEFENIPAQALNALAEMALVRPSPRALQVSQDRLAEKQFLQQIGLETATFAEVNDLPSLRAAVETVGTPSILKTRRFGYDGKGQARLTDASDLGSALTDIAGAPAILEGFVDFTSELSVIVARGIDGQIACFDPGENVHKDGILHTTRVPCSAPMSLQQDCILAAGRIANALDYVGVMGVEFFATPHGPIVNEIAPRVHNSGHWTQNGCLVDQFEQHIRAIAGWPLGDGSRHCDIEMTNLIGHDVDQIDHLRKEPCAIHLYGKAETRPGRKMGHVNRILG